MHGPVSLVAVCLCMTTEPPLPGSASPDYSGEVLYQIMPIAWRDSDSDPARFGDFGGLTASLDYLHGLGITAVYLNPIFPSKAYHGYQHGDAARVNPWFGTEEQFRAFVRSAHQRGIKVLLDFVAYGISQESEWFGSARGNPSSPYDSWLAFRNPTNTRYQGYTFRTWNGDKIGFIHWNLNDPGPADLVTAWATKWIEPTGPAADDAVDGFRLDHTYSDAPEGWGATIAFWERWSGALRRVNRNVFLFAEPGDWSSYGADLLTPGGFDAVIAKPLEFAARNALMSGSSRPLRECMSATLKALPPGKTLVAEINDHDSDRVASLVDGDLAASKLAAAILLTQPFTPNIYFGDEIGMLGRKASYGGDANDLPMREPFKWNATAGPPMSDYDRLNRRAYTKRYSRDHDGRSVQEQTGRDGTLLEEYKRLIALRRTSPALKHGAYHEIASTKDQVWSFLRIEPGGSRSVLVVLNVGMTGAKATLDLSGLELPAASLTPRDMLTGADAPPVLRTSLRNYPIELLARGYVILSIDAAPRSKDAGAP